MKLLVVTCLIAFIALVAAEHCQDKDPLTCTVQCPTGQIHGCHSDRCFCRTGDRCLMQADCHAHCNKDDNHIHCVDGECHCVKLEHD